MQIIPLKAEKAQTEFVTLGDQYCQIDVAQKLYGLFLNLYVDGKLIVAGAICQDRNRLVRSTYLGFSGDLMFMDTIGTEDPTYDGLGSRYVLAYLLPSEVVD